MITNILATITVMLTTNVTERVPMTDPNFFTTPYVNASIGSAVTWPSVHGLIYQPNLIPVPDPHQKWIRTTVKRQTFIEFIAIGTPFRALLKEEVVSDSEVEYWLERKEEWKRVGVGTINGAWITNKVGWSEHFTNGTGQIIESIHLPPP